jgi:sugar/nucleoside kinase (ribokinase family)
MPHGGKRAIVRCRDDDYLHPFPPLNLGECRALHVDGHQPDAAIHYARACREAGILTSLDGGGLRPNTHDLLGFIDVAIVAERLCEQMGLSPLQMLDYLKSRGCGIGGVTRGEWGMVWYDEEGETKTLPALDIPADQVVDTNGAGDIFHGSYVYSAMARPDASWREHFIFARAASAHSIQHLGNEASLPDLAAISAAQARYREKALMTA